MAAGKINAAGMETAFIPGCTVSESIFSQVGAKAVCFSLTAQTDISAESYGAPKIVMVLQGELTVYTEDACWRLRCGEGIRLQVDVPVGMRNEQNENCRYVEIGFQEVFTMNQMITPGKVWMFKDLLPYQQGRIVNMDIVHEPQMKFVLMSFAAGTGLTEHAAPGEALLFALDGEGIIGYEGQEYTVKAGEMFKFAKNGRHYVKADSNFKMALLVSLMKEH